MFYRVWFHQVGVVRTNRLEHNITFWMDLLKNKRKTSIHRHQTTPRYRHAIHGRRCTVQPPPFSVAPVTAKHDIIHKTGSTQRSATASEAYRATATGSAHKILCGSVQRFQRLCLRTERQTNTQTG